MSNVQRYVSRILLAGAVALALPSAVFAQYSYANAQLNAYYPYQCWLQEQAGQFTSQTTPAVSIYARNPSGAQWVRVRWALYKNEYGLFGVTTPSPVFVRMSNWWYGIAQRSSSPYAWDEYAELNGQIKRTTRPTVYSANPGWGLGPIPVSPLTTRYYALVQYDWVPNSTTDVKFPMLSAWAGGNCYWKYPR
jgi:hypothetical protein